MADTGTITDPQTVMIGTIAITGVKSISWNKNSAIVQAPAADGNTRAGAPYLGSEGGYGGTITFDNPILAAAAERLSGTLAVAVKGVGDAQADGTYSFAGAIIGSHSGTATKDAPGSSSLPFSFGSTDGTTDPVSFA